MCEFSYDLFIGLISGLIIWFGVEYLPRKKDKRNISFQIVDSSEKLLGHLMGIIETCLNSKEMQPMIWAHKEIDFSTLISNITMLDELKSVRIGDDGHNMTVGSSIYDLNIRLKKEVSNLLRFTYHLDTKLLKIISNIETNPFFEKWENIYKNLGKPVHLPPPYGTVVPPIPKLSDHFKQDLNELYNSYKRLEQYLFDTFPQNSTVLKRKDAKSVNIKRCQSSI